MEFGKIELAPMIMQRLKTWVQNRTLPGNHAAKRCFHAFVIRPFRVLMIRLASLRGGCPRQITVLIPFKNRSTERLRDCLRSLRNQTIESEQIKIIISDFGSERPYTDKLLDLCEEFDCTLVRPASSIHKGIWNRSLALNKALSLVTSSYIFLCDADMIVTPGYFEECLNIVEKDPLAVVGGPMMDLPQEFEQSVGHMNFGLMSEIATARHFGDYHPSIIFLKTKYLLDIGGLDERFEYWGGEDDDLFLRLMAYGLHKVSTSKTNRYFHQFHPKYEGVSLDSLNEKIMKNREMFNKNRKYILESTSLKKVR